MSTRGAIGFRVNAVDKVTYNHFDSYPGGIGIDVVNFISKTALSTLKKTALRIQLVTDEEEPTVAQISECDKFYNPNVGGQDKVTWYSLLREAQGRLDVYKKELKYMKDASDFLKDSLFCEYAYIINVDTGMLEFYKGFNEDLNGAGRYASLTRERKSEYFGVVLVKEYPLAEIYKSTKEAQYKIIDDMNKLTEEVEETV